MNKKLRGYKILDFLRMTKSEFRSLKSFNSTKDLDFFRFHPPACYAPLYTEKLPTHCNSLSNNMAFTSG